MENTELIVTCSTAGLIDDLTTNELNVVVYGSERQVALLSQRGRAMLRVCH